MCELLFSASFFAVLFLVVFNISEIPELVFSTITTHTSNYVPTYIIPKYLLTPFKLLYPRNVTR